MNHFANYTFVRIIYNYLIILLKGLEGSIQFFKVGLVYLTVFTVFTSEMTDIFFGTLIGALISKQTHVHPSVLLECQVYLASFCHFIRP